MRIEYDQIDAIVNTLRTWGVEIDKQTWEDLHDEFDTLEDPSENKLGPSVPEGGSKSAAKFNYPRSGSQRHRILIAIYKSGERGMTRDEVWAKMQKDGGKKKMAEGAIDARVWELGPKNMGYIAPNGHYRDTPSGSQAEVLVLTEKGLAAIRKYDPIHVA
jgi:hypothetical protein